MKQATVTIGGHQYTVKEGDSLEVDYLGDLSKDSPNALTFSKVGMAQVKAADGQTNILVGQPYLEGAYVEAQVDVPALRAPKILVFKKKRRKNYKRMKGHRQTLSRITITKIQLA
ncbi:MAG: 50S ribosomal protein L21 [Proteobacteria bacterium]|nr:50S ribosomal protein L21 [Pseudomonadota bacterium]